MASITDVRKLCEEYEVVIDSYSEVDGDKYITFLYKNDSKFFKLLFLLREEEYIFNFEIKGECIYLTVSGKDKLFLEIVKFISEEKENTYKDIEGIIDFLVNFSIEDRVNFITYFNGVSYFYNVNENKFGGALILNDFLFDGKSYFYQASNDEAIYEKLLIVNKDVREYKHLFTKIDVSDDGKNIFKNSDIKDIKEVYSYSGNRELVIAYDNYKYFVLVKKGNKYYKYIYDGILKFKSIIPELLDMFIKDYKSEFSEEFYSCIGKGYYTVKLDNSILNIYNMDITDVYFYSDYLKKMIVSPFGKVEMDKDYLKNSIKRVSYGYVNVLALSLVVAIFSVLVFLITLNMVK